ncbi:hypothetical protein ACLB2K_042291 [Fragaria x ananassa]
MELSGLVSHQFPYLSGASIDTRSSKPLLSGDVHFPGRNEFGASLRTRRDMNSGFCDNGHVEYYDSAPRCVISTGWDSKEDLAAQVQGKLISEGAEALLQHLEKVRAEEKELKKKKKEEKAKIKAELMTTMKDRASSSSSSSSLSSSEEEG